MSKNSSPTKSTKNNDSLDNDKQSNQSENSKRALSRIQFSSKKSLFQFIKFAIIGFFNTFVDLGILNFLMAVSGLTTGAPYAGFKSVSFLFASTSSYFLNKNWAFKDKETTRQGIKFIQFFLISVVGGIINVSVATLIVTIIKPWAIDLNWVAHLLNSINPTLGELYLHNQIWGNIGALGGTAIGLIWNFTGYKLVVFKK